MSDDAEKPFEPTPQRIAKARREGNVARSSELAANAAFAAALATLAGAAAFIGALARAAIVRAAAGTVPWRLAAAICALGLLPLAAACVAGSIAGVAQSGGLSFVAVTAKFERIDPFAGVRRILGGETVTHGVRAALAFTVASGAMLPLLVRSMAESTQAASVTGVAGAAWRAATGVGWAACGVGALFALVEYASARRSWLRKLRMSLEERKREAKEQEGDPHARGRRRSLHRSLLRGAIADVERAAFVVANPTHVAVALEYAPPRVAVPTVLVRATDEAALRLRAAASAREIPVIENVALARALFAQTQVGQPIAAAHYVAVAAIVVALVRDGTLEAPPA